MISNNYNPWTVSTLPVRRKSYLWPFIVAAVGLALAILALVYSGGFSAALKFLGVGAGNNFEVTFTSAGDWLGTSGRDYIMGGASMQSTGVFTDFPGLPTDPDSTPEGMGLVTVIFNNSADSNPEAGTPASIYVSPVLDLSVAAPLVTSIAVSDFVPETTEVSYAYRSAATIDNLSNQNFLPLELAVTDTTSMKVNSKSAVMSQTIERYLQIKLAFGGGLSSDVRPAVYALTVQYQDSAEAGGDNLGGGTITPGDSDLTQKNISLQYSEINAPTAASITIISANLSDPIAYLAENVNLSQRNSLSIDTSLIAGAYALQVAAPGIRNKVVPFVVDNDSNIVVNTGSFEAGSSGGLSADLNGDGIVNSIDMLILFSQYMVSS